jgi:DNA (cytosine-5)-methyltransferase 1
VEKTLWRIAQGIRKFVLENPRPFLVSIDQQGTADSSAPLHAPLSTVVTKARHALIAPHLVKVNHGKREARGERIDMPLSTVTAARRGHALVAAFLAKYFGDPRRADGGGGVVLGQELDQPIGTVTARDHHGLAAVTLATFRGTHPSQPGAASVEEPLPTISAGGIHVAEVRAFLTAYYGSDGSGGQLLTEPMRSITAKHRLGLVTVHGVDYQIADIGLRMLEPEELKRATYGKYADRCDLSAAKTKAAKVKLLGNAVPPELVEAVVRSNLTFAPRRAAA